MTKQFIEPPQIAAYLQTRGWRQQPSFCEDKASLWLAPAEGDADVLLPRRATLGDYQLRMDTLLRDVAAVEGRTRKELLQDLALVNADVLHLRLRGEQSAAVPFRKSVKLLRSLQDVFTAAALAAIEKRAFFTNRKVEKVRDYVSHLQFGHTEQSSFAFTVASPLPAQDAGHADASCEPEAAEPFARQVTQTLMHALKVMERAAKTAQKTGAVGVLKNAVKVGVSANLCDAIADVVSKASSPEIELSMRWAATTEAPGGTPDRAVFRKDSGPIFEAAGDAFWGMPKAHDAKIEGTVSALHTKDGGAEAVIVGFVGGHARQIRTVFGGEFPGELLRAYEQRLPIKCEGDLVREEGQYVLKNARYFEIIAGAL